MDKLLYDFYLMTGYRASKAEWIQSDLINRATDKERKMPTQLTQARARHTLVAKENKKAMIRIEECHRLLTQKKEIFLALPNEIVIHEEATETKYTFKRFRLKTYHYVTLAEVTGPNPEKKAMQEEISAIESSLLTHTKIRVRCSIELVKLKSDISTREKLTQPLNNSGAPGILGTHDLSKKCENERNPFTFSQNRPGSSRCG